MSRSEQTTWDRLYADGDYVPREQPSPFLESWLLKMQTGRALDVACGTGRHALRLAEVGFAVDAVDISPVALQMAAAEAERRSLSVDWRAADLDQLSIERSAYQLITVFRFRNPALWSRLRHGLAPNGWILVEHHLLTSRRVDGPGPDFRVTPGELLDAFRTLRIVHYTESIEEDERGSIVANVRLAACNGDPGW